MEIIKREGWEDPGYRQAWEAVQINSVLDSRKAEEAAADPSEVTQKDQKVRIKEIFKIKEGLLYRKGMFWIPENSTQAVLLSEHDTKVAGHMGQNKTIELISRNFCWPKMNERIIAFVRSCPECQQIKVFWHQP